MDLEELEEEEEVVVDRLRDSYEELAEQARPALRRKHKT
jgi:hypothetical protein